MLTNDEVSTWIAALRSDEYIQGRRAMCRETERGTVWDPLGVLVNEIWDGYWVLADDGDLWGIKTRAGWYWSLPPESVGIPLDLTAAVAHLNDHSGWSFLAIAEWLEGRRAWRPTHSSKGSK